jgi:hypothetical protein
LKLIPLLSIKEREMYLVRRAFILKRGESYRKAAEIISEMGKSYEKAGRRSPTRVYWSGGTVPGQANTVYMDWTEETIGSPFDPSVVEPEGIGALYEQLHKLQEESYIEFYEMV